MNLTTPPLLVLDMLCEAGLDMMEYRECRGGGQELKTTARESATQTFKITHEVKVVSRAVHNESHE